MGSSFFRKLKALMKKNLIIMKRNILSTIFEIFFPVVLFFLIIILRKSFPIANMSFEEFDHNLTYFMENKSIISSIGIDEGLLFRNYTIDKIPELIKYIDFSKINFSEIDFHNFTFKEFDYLIDQVINSMDFNFSDFVLTYLGIPIMIPPLYICSSLNEQNQTRPLIGSIGIPIEIKYRMIVDSWFFYKLASFAPDDSDLKYDFKLKLDCFKEFEPIEDIELEKVAAYESALLSYAQSEFAEDMKNINANPDYNDEMVSKLTDILNKFKETQTF